MHDVDVRAETYEFTCLRCSRSWQRTYEVRQSSGWSSGWTAYFSYEGVACPPPWQQGQVCPFCGGLRVRLIPNGQHLTAR